MTKKRINVLLWVGLAGTLIFGTNLFVNAYRIAWGDHSMWWTHKDMQLPLEKANDNFELYIRGKLLQKHFSEKTLFSVDENLRQNPISSEDITVRMNNWEKIKSSILAKAIALLLFGWIQHFKNGKKFR
jgi:hypothetical protein